MKELRKYAIITFLLIVSLETCYYLGKIQGMKKMKEQSIKDVHNILHPTRNEEERKQWLDNLYARSIELTYNQIK
ncbi:MAG: hypothetical protein JWQ09_5041 [Segetibacter sp.]|nr:hypothetical protein [Segetibacter sp.]